MANITTAYIHESAAEIGYSLKPKQLEAAIEIYIEKRDTMIIAPTGFGKSLLYILAPIVQPTSSTLVILPLLSMINDNLQKISAVTDTLDEAGAVIHLGDDAQLDQLRTASYILATPESILAKKGRSLLRDKTFQARLKTVFIDECHCVITQGHSEEGDPFRESYSRLAELRSFVRHDTVFVGMSATVTPSNRAKILASLGMTDAALIAVDPNKANITYEVHNMDERAPGQFQFLIDMINEKKSSTPRTIVFFVKHDHLVESYSYITHYTGQQPGCEAPLVAMYHRSTTTEIKNQVIADMKRPDGVIRVVLATSSLSMGIDMAGIKYVIHHGVPMTSDDFLQETGRAGREADSICHSILLNYPHSTSGRAVSKSMMQFKLVKQSTCRRNILLADYNSSVVQDVCCDICNPGGFGPYDFTLVNDEAADDTATQSSHSPDDFEAETVSDSSSSE